MTPKPLAQAYSVPALPLPVTLDVPQDDSPPGSQEVIVNEGGCTTFSEAGLRGFVVSVRRKYPRIA